MAMTDGNIAAGTLVLLRHGQTVWSQTGQYTGRTDIPLTAQGEQQARDAGERLRARLPEGFESDYVFCSPLARARRTAELAGFPDYRECPDIMEWNYGLAEGRSPKQIDELLGHHWDLMEDGVSKLPSSFAGDWTDRLPDGTEICVHNHGGESIEDIAERARKVVERVDPMIREGHNVLLVAHGHILRMLATQWLGVEPIVANQLRLGTAAFSLFGVYKGRRVLRNWNL